MDSSDSDEGGKVEWEVVSMTGGSDADCSAVFDFFDGNGNGEDGVRVTEVDVHPEHFVYPTNREDDEEKTTLVSNELQEKDANAGNYQEQEQEQRARDWIEPSASGYSRPDADLLSSLILEESFPTSIPRKKMTKKEQQGKQDESESYAALEREILSESGFSSLVPSDVHGNVKVEEEENEEEEEDEVVGDGDGGWRKKMKMMWKEYVASANTLWSLTIAAAALMGILIIGQRWHSERLHNHQLRLQLCCKDEKISQLLFQISRLKEALGGRRRVAVIRATSTS